MATKAETRVVYAAGVAQGIALVTFPSVSTVLTDPAEYDLSNTQYGTLFLPQVVTAIIASLVGASLGTRLGTKRIYLAGLVLGLVSMALLLISAHFVHDQEVAYGLLLVATGFLGAGFGLCVPALNTFAATFNPQGVDRAILALNALLGLGTVLAPVFVAIFLGLGAWWGLPITSIVLLAALLLVSLRLPLRTGARATATRERHGFPARFWVYAAFGVLYGICETVNGNWSQLDMTSEVRASATAATLALTAFWGMVTLGRVFFAAVERWFPARATYRLLPFVLAAAFVLVSVVPTGDVAFGVIAFGLAGLGCSALLPLTISLGQKELTAVSAAVAGGVIAFYQFGYGVAAFGIGPLVDHGVSLTTVYKVAALIAVVMGLWSFVVARGSTSSELHSPKGGDVAGDTQVSTGTSEVRP